MKIKRIFYYYWQSVKQHRLFLVGIFVFYGLAVISSNTISPILFKNVVDAISGVDYSFVDPASIYRLLLLLLLNVLFYNIFFRLGDYAISYFEARGMRDISKDTFQRLSKHSYSFFANSFAGALVAKAKRFTSSFEGIVDRISFDLYFIALKIIGALVVLFIELGNWAFVFVAWLIAYICMTYFFLKKKRKYDLKRAETDSHVTASIADVISNILNVKIFSSARKEQRRHGDVLDDEYDALITAWNYQNFQLIIQGFMIAFLQVGALFLSVYLWTKGQVSTGVVVLVQTYMIVLFDALWNMGRAMMRFIKDLSNAEEMVEIFERPIGIQDSPSPVALAVKDGKIEFNNVSFEYVEDNEVFKNFNLQIKSKEKIGLVGYSGSGKSTITKMLLRFVDIKEGEILIDSQNVKNLTQDDLRSVISYVPQEPILFHRSIRENIGYAKDDATMEEIIDSARKSHAHEFISKLSKSYDTLVGERGIKLSGGERQRIAIARAMLKNAPILVLDEATSSLDSESEHYIQEAFRELMKGKTTIVIAHRLSTIQKMDRIIVLDKGRIVEQGSHPELLELGGVYTKLWNHQTGAFINE